MPPSERPLVSIVTPTLNQGRFIEHTIRSIKAQTYPQIEHIVVDGGSTDDTLDILRRHQGSYNLRWISEPDHGMYEAVNKGMRLATGEILAYLNSDDLYFPWTLDVVADAFERRPRADFIHGDALGVEDETGRRRMYWQQPYDLEYLRTSGFLAQPAVFWRRRVLGALGGFDESLKYVADCDFWMRAGRQFRFAKVNEFLAVERDHASSLRESGASALSEELATVRARYATPTHRGPRKRMPGPANRERAWRRLYWLSFLVQSLTPAGIRRGPWSHFLAADKTDLIVPRVLQALLPGQGDMRFRVMPPSRRWLEPPT